MASSNFNERNDIMEEIHYIMNLAHAEYHICETCATNNDNPEFVGEMAEQLQIIRLLRRSAMVRLSEERPAVVGTWCIIKHLCISMFHAYELFEVKRDPIYIKDAQEINMILDEILSHTEYKKLKKCSRCDKDAQAD